MTLPFHPGVFASFTTDVVLCGEHHGTEEAPLWFAGCIEHALLQGHRVLVGLEMPEHHTSALRAFLKDVKADAQETLAEAMSGFWNTTQDGRASHAIWQLVCTCRTLAHAHPDLLDVAAFCPDLTTFATLPGHNPQARHEHGMAKSLHDQIQHAHPALTLALMGNLHARRTPGAPWDPRYTPMGAILAKMLAPKTVTHCDLKAAGGQAWAMHQGEGVGVFSLAKKANLGPQGQAVACAGGEFYGVEVNLGEVTASLPKFWREKAHALQEDS